MAVTESYRVPDPCCHLCLALIAMYNLRHSIKTGNKAKKGSVCTFGQSDWAFGKKVQDRFQSGRRGKKRNEKGKQMGKGEREEGKGNEERKESPSIFVCLLTLTPEVH